MLHLIGQRLRDQPPGSDLFLNINVPSQPLDRIFGVQVTRLGDRSYGESVRQDGTGPDIRYWIDRNRPISGDQSHDTDIWALNNNVISVTPLQPSMGRAEQIGEVETLLAGLPSELLAGHH